MKRLLFLLVLVVGFLGCKKDEDINRGSSESNKIYSFEIYNNSPRSSYRFRIMDSDGSTILRENVISSGGSMTYNLEADKRYYWDALQLNGYVLYPTKQDGSFYLDTPRYLKFPY